MADKPPPNSISTNPDDGAGYRRAAGRPRSSPRRDTPRLLGINLIMAILVAGLVVAGWFIANQHQQLLAERKALGAAEARLGALEDRLRVTDKTMTESGQDTKQQIGFWESEIRKLWAVSNERNRKWIKDNEANLAKMQKSLETLQSSNRDLTAAVARHETAFSQQKEILDQLAGIDVQIQQMVSAQRDLVDKVNASQQTVASLRAGFAKRVQDNEQAIAAIDAYRLQLNTRLADIERRLNALAGASTL